jgi:aryl-alcohol dehydrogenase-like predicted oxidoreductase
LWFIKTSRRRVRNCHDFIPPNKPHSDSVDNAPQFFLPEEQRTARIISAVKSVSEQVGRSMAQVALARLRHQTVSVARSKPCSMIVVELSDAAISTAM